MWVAVVEPDPITLRVSRRRPGGPTDERRRCSRQGRLQPVDGRADCGAPGGTFGPVRSTSTSSRRGGRHTAGGPTGRRSRCRRRPGRRSWPRRPTPPSSSSTTRRAASRTAAGATGWPWRSMIWRPLRPRRRPSRTCSSRPATRSTPTRSPPLMPRVLRVAQDRRRRRDQRVRLAPAHRWTGPGDGGARLHRRDRQPPVELRRVPGDVPARLVTRAVAGDARPFPPTCARPPRRRPGPHQESWARSYQRRAVP